MTNINFTPHSPLSGVHKWLFTPLSPLNGVHK